MTRRLLPLLTAMLLLAACETTPDAGSLDTLDDQVAYIVGHDLGAALHQQMEQLDDQGVDLDEAVILGDRVVVISYRPGQIKEIVDVNLPRPRFSDEQDVKLLPEYSDMRDHIWRLVKDEALQTARGAK